MSSPTDIPAVVFIGSPTRDLVLRSSQATEVTGGAAYISALACRWAGATAGIVARVPPLLPASTAAVFGPGGLHRGGLQASDGELPGFTITYDDTDRATYSDMRMGLETGLRGKDLPPAWATPGCQWIHIAGIGASSRQQWESLQDLRRLYPAWNGTLSAGTCRAMIEADPETSRKLLETVDVFFMNVEEFTLLCPDGAPAQTVVVVTHGPDGVSVWREGVETSFPAATASVVDPTGAGDAFCGAYIGASVLGHPQPEAQAAQAAKKVLEGLGAEPLATWVAAQVTRRATDDPDRAKKLRALIEDAGAAAAFDFAGSPHLPPGHPMALQMLFVATLHQFGFWTSEPSSGWTGPMIAPLDGKAYKGSDFIWAAFSRAALADPTLLSLDRMACESDLFRRICEADDGTCPVPDLETHEMLHQAHAVTMQREWPGGYAALVEHANQTSRPIETLLQALKTVPGYNADALAKKANLLAVILAARPERFLKPKDPDSIAPIVDYHMMRLCLRTGLVRIHDPELERRLIARMWVDTTEELEIRQATGRAILSLVESTGCTVADIDGLFFRLGRTVCLETSAPRCDNCPLSGACARHTTHFQPIIRTQAY